MFLLLFATYFLSVVSVLDKLYSATIRDNKLIAIYNTEFDFNVYIKVYELKDGTVADIYNNGKIYNFGRPDYDFGLVHLDAPEHLPEVKNKLWLKFKLVRNPENITTSPIMNWVGYVNLDDMSFKNDSSFIKFPTHENFPVKDYTVNSITNKFGSALYITGGMLYSKKDSDFLDNYYINSIYYDYIEYYLDSNSFYKYNFTSKEWIDMTHSANGKLKPLSGHKSVVIDNRYLVVLGGRRQIIYNSKPDYNGEYRPFYEYYSLYNLTIFDTHSNSWENVNIKADIFDANNPTFEFEEFLATAHNDKIIVLSGYTYKENIPYKFSKNANLGILDFKTKNWAWTPIRNEDNSNISLQLIHAMDLLVFNDQLIICSDGLSEKNYIPIHVYDMLSQTIKSTLRSSKSPNDSDYIKEKNELQNQSKTMPTYAIILIAVSCTLLFGVFIYLLYLKINKKSISENGKTKSNRPIREVWANPDIYNTNNIITFDKANCSSTLYPNEVCQKPENLNISNKIEFDK